MTERETGCEVVITRSGMPAMFDRATGEVMHPVVGPLLEAEQIYVTPSRLAARLAVFDLRPLVLLDIGLGAGSNAIVARRISEAMPAGARRLEIVSFDKSLEPLEVALGSTHRAAFGLEGEAGNAARTLLEERRHETARTLWRLVQGDLPAALSGEPDGSADMVYWDAFSPRANPELWTLAAFQAVRRVCGVHATLQTYSGATATRSALLLAGFSVGLGVLTVAKRQTTWAALDLRDLDLPLDRRWLERLGRSSAPFPTDAPADALERVGALTQFSE